MRAGTSVTLCIGAANRDPAQFDDPETLDIGRTPNRHLAFGTGAHQCAGMALARLEGAIAISRFLARFPRLRAERRAGARRPRPLSRIFERALRGWFGPVRLVTAECRQAAQRPIDVPIWAPYERRPGTPMGMSDLRDWLRGNNLEQYADAFEANDIDLDVLAELTDRDLEQLGLSLGNRRRLLKAIAGRSAEPGPSKPAPAEAPGSGDAERRQVTVLFADMVGSTAVSGKVDPELLGH